MTKEKAPYSPTPGDYDNEKLTDLHSPNTKPSSYARNIELSSSTNSRSKDSYNLSDRSIQTEKSSDPTERIPSIVKYSDINKDADKTDFKGEI